MQMHRRIAVGPACIRHAGHNGVVLLLARRVSVSILCQVANVDLNTPAEYVLTEVHKAGFKEPTPIQVSVWTYVWHRL